MTLENLYNQIEQLRSKDPAKFIELLRGIQPWDCNGQHQVGDCITLEVAGETNDGYITQIDCTKDDGEHHDYYLIHTEDPQLFLDHRNDTGGLWINESEIK